MSRPKTLFISSRKNFKNRKTRKFPAETRLLSLVWLDSRQNLKMSFHSKCCCEEWAHFFLPGSICAPSSVTFTHSFSQWMYILTLALTDPMGFHVQTQLTAGFWGLGLSPSWGITCGPSAPERPQTWWYFKLQQGHLCVSVICTSAAYFHFQRLLRCNCYDLREEVVKHREREAEANGKCIGRRLDLNKETYQNIPQELWMLSFH